MYYDANGNELTIIYDSYGNVISESEETEADINRSDLVGIYLNQCGYDTDKQKIVTISNTNGKNYIVHNADGTVAKYGKVINEKADISDLGAGEYYMRCNGVYSSHFKVADNRLFNVSIVPAMKFMEMARQDAFEVGGSTGYAWRDSHQFSFELHSLCMLYKANPDYWKSLPWDVYKVNECEYEELRVQDCPNIVWLMKFAIMRYHKWNTVNGIQLHGLIKEQVAYFLYIYPLISEYVSHDYYVTIRDWLISIWGINSCNKRWYQISGENHNLYSTQSVIGTVKGQYPAGHQIMPNLFMYEVCKRDGISYQNFYDAGMNNLTWLVNDVDLLNPANTKGQRMNEYIVFHNLCMAYEMYKESCPVGTYEKIKACATEFCRLSHNKWDYVKFSDDVYVNGEPTFNGNNANGLANQPGNVAGFMAIAYALIRCLDDSETELIERLEVLAVSHIDHVYGRNPYGRHFCNKAAEEFDGATKGWAVRYKGGLGALDEVIGVLDGSPKEESYPFNPSADIGYCEGWVAFNTAWNMSLAYLLQLR